MTVAGIDIGGTKCATLLACVEDGEIRFLCRTERPTVPDWHDCLQALARQLREDVCAHGLDGGQLQSIGISCGGPLDARRGLILSPPNLIGWDKVPVSAYFAQAFGVPVRLMNDADACALAEWRYGAGKGTQHFVFLTMGTGLGAGLILNGKLYEGASSSAGEVGHVRLRGDGPVGYGKRGSFEGFCSGGGIARLARSIAEEELQQGRTPAYVADGRYTTKEVAAAARAGDAAAVRVFAEAGARLGEGLAVIADLLNPEKIAVGGIFMRAENLLRPSLEQTLRRECLPATYRGLQVVPAQLGERIGDYGAVVAALSAK